MAFTRRAAIVNGEELAQDVLLNDASLVSRVHVHFAEGGPQGRTQMQQRLDADFDQIKSQWV